VNREQAHRVPADFHFIYVDGVLSLGIGNKPGAETIAVNFSNPALNYRVRNKIKSQSIAKAVGVKPGLRPTILDATAGLGKDAFLLASMGCQVSLFEKSPLVYALLQDGIKRALSNSDARLQQTVQSMNLTLGDFMHCAKDAMASEVVYLDPMFPPRRKSARVKKDMFVLQQLLGENTNPNLLLSHALEIARRRVVVKRSKTAAYLSAMPPTFELKGKSSRYDVYLVG